MVALVVVFAAGNPVDSAQIAGTVVAVIVAVAGGFSALWRWSRQATTPTAEEVPDSACSNSPLLRLCRTVEGQLTTLGKIDISALGARDPRTASGSRRDQLPYASRNV